MKTSNYLTRTFSVIGRRLRAKGNGLTPSTNELVHPRFGLTDSDNNAQKKAPNSLLFLMYSKENETLFI